MDMCFSICFQSTISLIIDFLLYERMFYLKKKCHPFYESKMYSQRLFTTYTSNMIVALPGKLFINKVGQVRNVL